MILIPAVDDGFHDCNAVIIMLMGKVVSASTLKPGECITKSECKRKLNY